MPKILKIPAVNCRCARCLNPEEWLETCPEDSQDDCTTLREWIFSWEPDLRESIKWNMFCYSGRRLACAIGGYKQRAGLSFFRGQELPEAVSLCTQGEGNVAILSMRIDDITQVDRGAPRRLLRAAVRLDESVPPPRLSKTPRPMPAMPPVLSTALKKNRSAQAGYNALSPSCQREYIAWISRAKRQETRAKRVEETIAALAQGRK
jgi:uncharacterized protein YdeI (YjbR/CyaY-like superfamily)